MNISKFKTNVSYALVAQAISLAASLFVSLIIPKCLDLEQFGFWQLFTFYSSYVGFFHFGLNDGVYLIKGGKSIDEIERDEIKAQFFCGLVLEILVASFISVIAVVICDDGDRTFVLCSTAVYLVLKNSSDYYGYVFQATNDTRLYSIFSIIDRCSFLLLLMLLVCFNENNYRYYVAAYLIARAIGTIYCIKKATIYFQSYTIGIQKAVSLTIDSMKVGVKLLLANLTSMLVLGVARFLIDESWGIVMFGQLSLALSLVNFVLVFATQFAMVLFPALRQSKRNERLRIYSLMRECLRLSTPLVFLLYFPMFLLIKWWLPEYSETAKYLGLLLPICVFDVKMNLLGTTFFKVLRKENALLACNVGCLCLSACLSLIGVYVLKNIVFVVISMVFCIVIRSVFADWSLSSFSHQSIFTVEQALEIGLTVVFMSVTALLPLGQAFVIVLLFCFLYCFVLRGTLVSALRDTLTILFGRKTVR